MLTALFKVSLEIYNKNQRSVSDFNYHTEYEKSTISFIKSLCFATIYHFNNVNEGKNIHCRICWG